MSVTITITAANAESARNEILQFIGAGRVVHASTVGEIELSPTVTVDVGFDPLAAAASEASKVEIVTPTDIIVPIKKSRKKPEVKQEPISDPNAPVPAAEEVISDDLPAEAIKLAEAIVASEKPVDRDDVKAMVVHLHKQIGESFIPRVMTILAKYGAKKQSEVEEKDLSAFYEELCAMQVNG